MHELRERGRVAVLVEEVLVALDLRMTGLQRGGERVPVAGVGGHADHHPADIGRLGAVQVEVGGRGVRVQVAVALEHAE